VCGHNKSKNVFLEIYEKAELISYCCATSNIADPTVQNKVKLIGHSQIVFSMLHKLVYIRQLSSFGNNKFQTLYIKRKY